MNDLLIKTVEYKNHRINISYDDFADSPRTWDNLGTLIAFHNRYDLGDNSSYNKNDFNSWDDLEKSLLKEFDGVLLPVYMYEHSGVSLQCAPFGCSWDSGQVGFIGISRVRIFNEYGYKTLTKKRREQIEEYLKNEIEDYSKYLNGDVYYFEVLDSNGDILDSCGGFYDTESVLDSAKGEIDATINYKLALEGEQLSLNLGV